MKKNIADKKIASLSLIMFIIFIPGKALCFDEIKSKNSNHNEFAFDLLREAPEKGNVFFSPYSISMALSIVYDGTDDDAAKEINRVLYSDLSKESIPFISSENKPFDISVANALWKRKGKQFRNSYIDLIKSKYKAYLSELEFCSQSEESRNIINLWVSEKTKNKIIDLLEPGSLNCETPLVITNAIYFKSDWKYKFPERNTRKNPFWLTNDSSIITDFMHLDGKYYHYYDRKYDNEILELPYAGNELSMYVILPVKGLGTAKVIQDLSFKHFAEVISKKEMKNVFISFPKFKYELYFDHLTKAMKKLGVEKIFSSKNADFSKMTIEPNGLNVSEIIHKAYIEVDEVGTTAAAATGIKFYEGEDSPPPPPFVTFHADHPFVFIIYHKPTDSILFVGKVENPLH